MPDEKCGHDRGCRECFAYWLATKKSGDIARDAILKRWATTDAHRACEWQLLSEAGAWISDGACCGDDDPCEPGSLYHAPAGWIELNMNDTFSWGTAESAPVPPEDAPFVHEMFKRFGQDGLTAWVAARWRCKPMHVPGRNDASIAKVNEALAWMKESDHAC